MTAFIQDPIKLQQSTFDLLIRFQTYHVGLTADIEKAFLMIGMAEEDQDVLRFLWVDDITSRYPNIVKLRFARVVFGVSSSLFLLNATLRHLLRQQINVNPTMVEKLARSFYVDDAVTRAQNEDEAYILYKLAKSIFKKGGFNLRKFCSNSRLLQMRINYEENLSCQTVPMTTGLTETDETYASAILR